MHILINNIHTYHVLITATSNYSKSLFSVLKKSRPKVAAAQEAAQITKPLECDVNVDSKEDEDDGDKIVELEGEGEPPAPAHHCANTTPNI